MANKQPEKRKGARSRAAIPAEVLRQLNRGELETASLSEGLAIDFQKLLSCVAPELSRAEVRRVSADLGITARMATAGEVLRERYGLAGYDRLAGHPSDTVRGWAAYLLASAPELTLRQRLQRIRPLADDPHFGVREWAWLALRPHVAADITTAIQLLTPWTAKPADNLRRYAVEISRPRGVWCAHLAELKQQPERGLPVLEPLRADPARYVQDSVANWLNDAGKSQPDWVRSVCATWLSAEAPPATQRICQRALRNLIP